MNAQIILTSSKHYHCSKGQKRLVCGLTAWYIDPWRAAQTSLQPGEALPMGTSLPEGHTLVPVGRSVMFLFQTSLQAVARCLAEGLSPGQIKPILFQVWEIPPLPLLLSPWWSRLPLFHAGSPLTVFCISLVWMVKRPNRQRQSNLFTIWKNTIQGIN